MTAMKAKPTKAVGYVRVSTEGQATEVVSLEAQRDWIDAWCRATGWAFSCPPEEVWGQGPAPRGGVRWGTGENLNAGDEPMVRAGGGTGADQTGDSRIERGSRAGVDLALCA